MRWESALLQQVLAMPLEPSCKAAPSTVSWIARSGLSSPLQTTSIPCMSSLTMMPGEPSSDLSVVRKVSPTCSICLTTMSPPGLRTMPVKVWDSTIPSDGISTDATMAVKCFVTTILLQMTTPLSMVLNGIVLPPQTLITLRLHPNTRRFSITQRAMPVGQRRGSIS